ncbi:extracellular solute-binding protein [Paenibacillus eucommiae]|uniref:Aldouronate transport system substrate-binding protein n=1 Tax=Paenibacillus eucommiae TaxID=1355755 RepID=A0ABS4ITS5_9BACL|nr:extracellular solute-binding protein [Paenibacillus eucommiae]MBP1990948.1 putative aldouronate transport system substrate-binding protein [Paenibacillus eucommiae]
MKGKTAKRLMVCLLVFSMILVSACSSKQKDGKEGEASATPTSSTEASSTPKETPAASHDPLGKIDPPIEVTAVRQLDSTTKFVEGESIEKNAWNQLYEDEFGIKLKYLWVADPSQYNQKFNVTMASGKLPDIMPVDSTQFNQLVEADQLEDLTEALENYGLPITKELLTKDGGVGLNSATFGGKLLGIPVNPGAVDNAPLLWVRSDWLKKLNLPEPKTMEDVFKIAEAFATQDPDGNKVKDTFGLGVDKLLYDPVFGLTGFFNGYHAYPKIWVENAAGEYVYGSIQPEMKEGLAKLQNMYQTGVLDREFGVKDIEKLIQMGNAGKLGMFYGVMYGNSYFLEGKKLDTEMDWIPYALPSIDAQAAKPQLVFPIGKYYAVKKGMKHPEALIKMLNAFSNDWDRTKYPLTAINQDGDIAKWMYALVAGANPTQNLDMYDHVSKAIEKGDESLLDPKAPGQKIFFDSLKKWEKGDIEGWSYARIYDAQRLLFEYNKNDGLLMTKYIAGPTATMVEKGSTLDKMELETFTKIIMGEAPIDTFDEFVANWKKLGGDTITQEVAKWKASK